jgi:hypothetical protein
MVRTPHSCPLPLHRRSLTVAYLPQAKIWDFLEGTCVHTIPVADATCVAWAVRPMSTPLLFAC